MIAPVFIVTLALMLALVSAAAPLAADVKVQKSSKKAIPKGLQMMQERMFGASKTIPNPIMNHMMAVHGKDQAAVSSATASAKSLPALEADTVNKKSAAKKDFKAQWTKNDNNDDIKADIGDIINYDFYPSDDHCHEDDLIGRMSYKFGVCAKIPNTEHSFKLLGYKYKNTDQTQGAGPVYEIVYVYYIDPACTNSQQWYYMYTGAAIDECKAFGYYQPDDKTASTWEDDMFGASADGNRLPSEYRFSNNQRHFFGKIPTPAEIFTQTEESALDTPAGAFQVSTDTAIVDEIENSYTLYSLATTAGACTGSNNNEKACKDAQEQAVMAQTWGNVKFDDCRYSYTVGDDDFYKNNGAPIYTSIVCDEERGPVYYEYHDAQCRKIFKTPDGFLAKGLSFNYVFGYDSFYELFTTYKFDDDTGNHNDDYDSYVQLNAVWTCKSSSKKSFYPTMVALVVGFVVVLPVTVFAFYMLNKRFGWSLGTACKRAFCAGDAEQFSDEGKSVELAPVNIA